MQEIHLTDELILILYYEDFDICNSFSCSCSCSCSCIKYELRLKSELLMNPLLYSHFIYTKMNVNIHHGVLGLNNQKKVLQNLLCGILFVRSIFRFQNQRIQHNLFSALGLKGQFHEFNKNCTSY